MTTVPDDHELATQIAREAGRMLVRRRAEGATKDDGDRESNELILARLAVARPDDAVLSEESRDDRVRLERERVWIVDPLDGTREFGEPPDGLLRFEPVQLQPGFVGADLAVFLFQHRDVELFLASKIVIDHPLGR